MVEPGHRTEVESTSQSSETSFAHLKDVSNRITSETKGQPLRRLKAEFALALTESGSKVQPSAVNRLIDAVSDLGKTSPEEINTLLDGFFPPDLVLEPQAIELLKSQLDLEAKRMELGKVEFGHQIVQREEAFVRVLIYLAKNHPSLGPTAKSKLQTYWASHSTDMRTSGKMELAFSVLEFARDPGADVDQERLLVWNSLFTSQEFDKVPYAAQQKATYEKGTLALNEEFWVEFAARNVEDALEFFNVVRRKKSQSIQIEDPDTLLTWLHVNRDLAIFARIGQEQVATFPRPSQIRDGDLVITPSEKGVIGIRIGRTLWSENPELWPLIVRKRVSVELTAEENRILPLVALLFKDEDSFSSEQMKQVAQMSLPLDKERLTRLQQLLPVSALSLLYASEKLPGFFTQDVLNSLRNESEAVNPSEAALVRLGAYLDMEIEESERFATDFEEKVEVVSNNPLRIKFTENPQKNVMASLRFAGSEKTKKRMELFNQRVEEGVIILPLDELSDSAQSEINNRTQLMQAIADGTFDWPTLPNILQKIQGRRSREVASASSLGRDKNASLVQFLERHATELSTNEKMQSMCQLLLSLSLEINAESSITDAGEQAGLVVTSSESVVKLFQQELKLKQLSDLVPLQLTLRLDHFDRDSDTLFTFNELISLRDKLSALKTELGSEMTDEALIKILVSHEVQYRTGPSPEQHTFVLGSKNIEESLKKDPLATLNLLKNAPPNSSLLEIALPDYLKPDLINNLLTKFEVLDLPQEQKEALLKLFFTQLAEPQAREKTLAPQITQADLLTLFWPGYQKIVNQSTKTESDIKNQFNQFETWLETLPLTKISFASSTLLELLPDLKGDSLVADVLIRNPALIEEILTIDPQTQKVSLNEVGLKNKLKNAPQSSNRYDRKVDLIAIVATLVENPQLRFEPTPLLQAILKMSAVYVSVKDFVLVGVMEEMFATNLETPEEFVALFDPDSHHLRLTYEAMKQLKGPIPLMSSLHQSGLYPIEPQMFEEAEEYSFYQDVLDNQISPLNSPKDLENLLMKVNASADGVAFSKLFKLIPVLKTGIIDKLKGSTFPPTFSEVCLKYAALPILLELLLTEGGAEAITAKSLGQQLASTSRQPEELINATATFCTPEFAVYRERSAFFMVNAPDLVFSLQGQKTLLKYQERFLSLTTPEDLQRMASLVKKIENSSSITVRRLADTFIETILNHPNPEEALGYIETIFQINPSYFPTTAELVIFTKLQYQGIASTEILKFSPTFKELDERQKFFWISLVMVRNHIQSDSRWLQMYIKGVETAQPLLERQLKGEQLSEPETLELRNMLRGWMILRELRALARSKQMELSFLEHLGNYDKLSTEQLIDQLLSDFNLSGETVSSTQLLDQVAGRFAGFMGINNWNELKQRGTQSREKSSAKNREITSLDYFKDKIVIAKSFHSDYFEDAIAEYGFQSKEFFKVDSDVTPGDIDALEMTNADVASIAELAGSYGDVVAIVEDSGQFLRTKDSDLSTAQKRKEQLSKVTTSQYELFPVGIAHPNHVGISVGLPITEVSAYMVKSDIGLKNLSFSLARKGLYTPIFSEQGVLVFSYEDFENLQKIFHGVTEFSDETPEVTSQASASYYSEVQNWTQQKFAATETGMSDNEFIIQANQKITADMESVMAGLGIKRETAKSLTVNGAAILNTGSSGRLTNIPGDYDFDLMILLDQADWDQQAGPLFDALKSKWSSTQDASHSEADKNYYLVKLQGADLGNGQKVDLDISIKLKSTYFYPASHEVIEQKLGAIRQQYGEPAYQEVVATVLYTKQLLKNYGAYKEGLKGIGTENWLLAHGGSLEQACRDFAKTAFGTDSQTEVAELKPLPLEEFKQRYSLLDPGINLKDMHHDRYFGRLTEAAYQGMCSMVRDVLSGNLPDVNSEVTSDDLAETT